MTKCWEAMEVIIKSTGSSFMFSVSSTNQLCDFGKLPNALRVGFLVCTMEIITIPTRQVCYEDNTI